MQISTYPAGTPSWVDLGSPDPAAASSFYSALFGWDIQEGPPEAGGYRMCLLKGVPVAGLGPAQSEGEPFWSVYVAVEDADATVKSVRDAGGQVLVEAMDVMGFGRAAVLADVVGAQFSIWQAMHMTGSGLIGEPGTMCWHELATRAVAEAKAFYASVFGWQVKEPSSEAQIYFQFERDGEPVAGLLPMDDDWPADAASMWGVYFAVEDTDAATQRVTELGGAVYVPPREIEPGRFSVVSDPHGAAFTLIRLKPELAR